MLAISVDTPEESKKLCSEQGYHFPFLADADKSVIRRYGVLHPGAGEGGKDVARPAEFLVDPSGTVRWANFTEDIRVRARADELLNAIEGLH